MDALYDLSALKDDIGFDDLEPGKAFPPYAYRVTAAHVAAYLDAVTGDCQGVDLSTVRTHRLLPSLIATNYGFVYAAMRGRLPQGFLNSTVDLDLLAPAHVSEELTMVVTVDDRRIKRERKHVVLRADVHGESGAAVACACIGCVLP